MVASQCYVDKAVEDLYNQTLTDDNLQFILDIFQQNMREALCFQVYRRHEEVVGQAHVNKRLYLEHLSILLGSPDYTAFHADIFDKIDALFNSSNHYVKVEAADVMQRFFPVRSERMLRQLQGSRPNRICARTIYDDKENVHDSDINASVLGACRKLMQMMVSSITFNDKYKLLVYAQDSPETIKERLDTLLNLDYDHTLVIYGNNDQENKIQERMHYKIVDEQMSSSHNEINLDKVMREYDVFIDNVFQSIQLRHQHTDRLKKSIKSGTIRGLSLIELLNAVWKYIARQAPDVQNEMKGRLREELEDAMSVCTTGIASRIINTIQGFFNQQDHPELSIKMSMDEQIKARLTMLVNKEAINNQLDPLLDKDQFITLLNKMIENHHKDLSTEISLEKLKDIMYKAYLI